ncbi:MAG: DNA-deoxyinosine glycosylase [Propionibacteriaceae bacterium]|nr:DNA-deoxyinosine glycosylase [Propionibacteriaceae bacterium]
MPQLTHPWPAVADQQSRVLILGTFPSPRSRQFGFYYGHPQNLFWSTLATVFEAEEPAATVEARRQFLLDHQVAVWDVVAACQIDGAADSSIRCPQPHRFRPLLTASPIQAIFTTGRKATDLFQRLCVDEAGMAATYLPSTSPANRGGQAKPEFWQQWRLVRSVLDGEASPSKCGT